MKFDPKFKVLDRVVIAQPPRMWRGKVVDGTLRGVVTKVYGPHVSIVDVQAKGSWPGARLKNYRCELWRVEHDPAPPKQ